MTREEAIEVLTDMRRIRSNTITEACDMAISALQDMPIHFGRCWDCVSFIAEGEKCKWDLLTGEDGYCHHFLEKYGELNCITESPNDVIEKNDEVIKSVRCKDCEWFDNCESFVTPPCTKQTEPSDFIRQETIKELGDWLEQMIQHGVPSHSAKRKALANAIALLSMDTHEIHTETHECVKETHDSDLISREDLLKKAEKGNITKYSTNSVNIITTDVVTVENIKKAPSADTPTTEVKKPTNTPTDLISRSEALGYPLGFDRYDKENGSREFICGVESYREYIQHLPSVKATENKYDCDLISREKAIESAEVHCTTDGAYGYMDIKSIVDMLESLPSVSADRPTEDRLHIKIYADDEPSRKAEKLYQICGGEDGENQEITNWLKEYFSSADTESDDLIIKNGKGIQDGLYNIKDGEIFKYKAKGGTVRAHKLVPSVSAERSGEWEYEIMVMPLSNHTKDSYRCSVCHTHWDCETNYCPNCGARMENKE